ncbi:34353_t:CDS:2 [Gigaspora margarita]|uniref:34353_t:CDS:1 n=1 Tax=Gigaspora margarita TaxID=4874 RepID=A0ABN7V1V6_GIGMA|nr:34353_t:CDS:2 [Gigaspora margarita]
MTRTKRPINEKINEVKEISQIERVQKGHGRGSRGSRNRRKGNRRKENCERGSCGKENLERGTSCDREYEKSAEASAPNIGLNDLDLNIKKKLNQLSLKCVEYIPIVLKTTSNLVTRALATSSTTDSEYSNISIMESPVNSRNKIMVSELLQISDSDISDDSFEYAYQRNYKKLTKAKKRQKNNNNEYEGDNEAVQSLRIRDAIKRLDYLMIGSGKNIASEIFLKINNNNNCI